MEGRVVVKFVHESALKDSQCSAVSIPDITIVRRFLWQKPCRCGLERHCSSSAAKQTHARARKHSEARVLIHIHSLAMLTLAPAYWRWC